MCLVPYPEEYTLPYTVVLEDTPSRAVWHSPGCVCYDCLRADKMYIGAEAGHSLKAGQPRMFDKESPWISSIPANPVQ